MLDYFTSLFSQINIIYIKDLCINIINLITFQNLVKVAAIIAGVVAFINGLIPFLEINFNGISPYSDLIESDPKIVIKKLKRLKLSRHWYNYIEYKEAGIDNKIENSINKYQKRFSIKVLFSKKEWLIPNICVRWKHRISQEIEELEEKLNKCESYKEVLNLMKYIENLNGSLEWCSGNIGNTTRMPIKLHNDEINKIKSVEVQELFDFSKN